MHLFVPSLPDNSVQMDRKSSIETEPRTLSVAQIEFAREAAVYVMKTKTVEEALSIFTEGLEPVVNAVKHKCNGLDEVMYTDTREELELLKEEITLRKFRDVVTAPF